MGEECRGQLITTSSCSTFMKTFLWLRQSWIILGERVRGTCETAPAVPGTFPCISRGNLSRLRAHKSAFNKQGDVGAARGRSWNHITPVSVPPGSFLCVLFKAQKYYLTFTGNKLQGRTLAPPPPVSSDTSKGNDDPVQETLHECTSYKNGYIMVKCDYL